MWTDEQLSEQGWTQDQIQQWKLDQEIQVGMKETGSLESIVDSEITDLKPGSYGTNFSSLFLLILPK